MAACETKLVMREDKQWQRLVYAEVLIPDTLNAYSDISTREDIVEFAHSYALSGFKLDVDHDREDVAGTEYSVVETFVAREGDPDFIPGSWVLGVKVHSDELWARILSGEINGFSYEATVYMDEVEVVADNNVAVSCTTEPHPVDGHTHTCLVVLDELNNPMLGSTSFDSGHSHRISTHTVTEVADGHNHRYSVHTGESKDQIMEGMFDEQ